MPEKAVLAFALGDPSGISAELSARILASETAREATFLVFGDRRLLAAGEAVAGISLDLPVVSAADVGSARPQGTVFVDLANMDPDDVTPGTASAAGGRAALENFRCATLAANEGLADAVFFTPFNKHAMRLAEPDYVDEIGFLTRTIEADRDGSEFNVLDEVWNARVTSHVPLSSVAAMIDEERVFSRIRLTAEVMERATGRRPRIGVAALNPHAGDGRNFGTEDDDVIRPAVERASAHQIAVTGPIPSDTVFVRALRGEFDAVLTMYHDQGQIAMKLIGFDRGVTLIAGYPFPVVTPAHGTAYDIAGKGVARDSATLEAVKLGIRLSRVSVEREPRRPLDELVDAARRAGQPLS